MARIRIPLASAARRYLTVISLALGLGLTAPAVIAKVSLLSKEAIQHIRAYSALINEQHERDIVLVEGPDGRLYFPIDELGEYIASQQVLPLALTIYGCAPCIPLEDVAEVSFDEAANRVSLQIRESYREVQRFGAVAVQGESLPLSYGSGLATSFNLLGRYDEESDTDSEDYAADLDLGVGLGRIGTLYTSEIFFKDGDSLRGQSYWETQFENAMVRMQVGDVISHSDSFGGAIQLGGIRIRRAFESRPDFNYRPEFKYFSEARLPGTLELLIDGQSVKKEEYDRGRLNFSNQMPYRGDELTLVLTDVMGQRTIVRQPLFDTSDNLAPGVVNFDVSYGAIREDENDYEDKYGSAFISTGITKHWTQSLAYQGDKSYEQASTELILSAGKHQLNVEGAYSQEKILAVEGSATIVDYSYDWEGDYSGVRFSVNWFETDQFSQFRGATLSGRGTSVSLSGNSGHFSYGISGFDIGGLTGGSARLGYSRDGWGIEAGAEYLETDDYIATMTLSYRPRGPSKPRLRVGHGWQRDNRSAAADISGNANLDGNYIGYQAAVAQDYHLNGVDSGSMDSRAGLNFRNNVLDMRGNYEDVRSSRRGSARIKTGFVINRHNAFLSSRDVSQAYATVLTDRENVRLTGGGTERKTDGDGEVSLPMPAYSESRVVIDGDSLAENDVLTQGAAKVRVAKANHAYLTMEVTQAPVIIHILNNGINDVFLNGRPFVHNDLGAYINQYNAGGENVLEVDGKRYTIELPMVKGELPVYEFDRANNRLIRVDALFRGGQ
ncbi:MAG: outer membrane usher protein FimD/PapC [Paracoccaceae bacterium]